MMYRNMECILKPLSGADGDPEKLYTRDVNEHVACGVGSFTKYAHGEFERTMKFYRGEDSVEVFCRQLKAQADRALRYKKKKMIPLTD